VLSIILLNVFRKRWIMFSPNDTPYMYPTRIPFEESTIYSQVNIKRPNFNKYPLFQVSIFKKFQVHFI